MATLLNGLTSKMAHWEILVNGKKANAVINKHVESVSVTYSLKQPTQAKIVMRVPTMWEDFFVDGALVEIRFGYTKISLVSMITGRAVARPEGSAEESIQYAVTVIDDVLQLNSVQRIKVFGKNPTKIGIISEVASTAGLIPNIGISDISPISQKYIPKIIGKTDLQFLYDCARKWHCIMWIEGNSLHFYDADIAHNQGDLNKIPNSNDFKLYYELGYRNPLSTSNIKSVNWKRLSVKKGKAGDTSSFGTDRKGRVREPSDYEIDALGKIWVFKAEVLKSIRGDRNKALLYINAAITGPVSETYARLRKYFKPLTSGAGSSTNNDKKGLPAHKRGKLELNVQLNVGDPNLRIPRTMILKGGAGDKGSPELPNYLFRDGKEQKYFANEVVTSLTGGMFETNIRMTMGV